MLCSVIIINYKTPELTINCLKSLMTLKKKLNLDIIVIDNASEDNSVELLETEFKNKITLIKNNKNLGFAKANNQGAEIAQGEFLLFLNNDTIINYDFISPCINILQNNNNIGAVSPILLLPNGETQKSAYGIFPTFWRLVLQITKIDPILKYNNGYAITDWISGCAFIIKKSVFQEIGEWDYNFFLYYEDIEICKRLKNSLYKVAVCKDANIIHIGGQSLKINTQKRKFFYISQDYYFKKYHNKISFYLIRILRSFYSIYLKIKNNLSA
jgi:GT2 family glycosyltransferase